MIEIALQNMGEYPKGGVLVKIGGQKQWGTP